MARMKVFSHMMTWSACTQPANRRQNARASSVSNSGASSAAFCRAAVIARPNVLAMVMDTVDELAKRGGAVVLTGGPGIGKSWLCEPPADGLASASLPSSGREVPGLLPVDLFCSTDR